MSFKDCVKTVKLMGTACEMLARGSLNSESVEEWLKRCTITLRRLGKLLRRDGIPVGKKQRILSCITQAKSAKIKLKTLLKAGGRLGQRERRSDRVQWQDLESAFEKRIRTGVIVNLKHIDIMAFFNDTLALFTPRVKNALKRQSALKVNSVFTAQYRKVSSDGEEVIDQKSFNTKNAAIFQTTNINEWFTAHIRNPILKDMEDFEERDSGWALHSLTSLTINMNKYNPMRGSSFIELPAAIKLKKACVNVKNADNQCFKWAILSALHPFDRNPNRVSKYKPYENVLNFQGIEFPVMTKDVHKFEKQNDISVNVYMLSKTISDQFIVSPTHVTNLKKNKHINLLLIQNYYTCDDGESEEDDEQIEEETPRFHYVWIKDLSALVTKQLSKNTKKKYICDRCLHYFHCTDKLEAHEVDCSKINKCKVTLPTTQNSTLKFTNFNFKQKVPFIVYADFECLLKNVQQPEEINQKTKVCQIHEAFSVGYYLKCSYDDTLSRYRSYRGENPAEWFVKELMQLAEDVETVFWCPLSMDALTVEEYRAFRSASSCHICEGPLLGKKKVRDHCHLTGKYRGPAHETCNLEYQDSHTIPVVFHNLSCYDGHFIIKVMASFDGRISLLPQNMERYISFTKHIKGSDISFRFIDSLRFMASSLDKLASYLTQVNTMRAEFPKINDAKFELLKRKGVFPYEYLDTWEKLESVTQLPAKEEFYSHLNDSHVSDEDYEHAARIWKQFGITSLGEYSDLYLKTDVLLLAEVFENFRENCLKTYGLDPAHYYTTPGLTWDAMLKYTKIQLQLLTDIDMIMFIERGIRGGISQCSNRYSKANNKYMPNFNPNEESKYLMYFDVNNLYGWAMTQHLPYGGFEWVENVENWNVPDDSPVGFILEVDLDYPKQIHHSHSDFPLCPEQMTPPGSKDAKLLTTLFNKSRYIIHYRNLKQALKYGLKLKKIHRILKFRQMPWMKTYIDMNTEMRKKATNDFEKNLYKLMNNAVFGKTMENVRKRVDVKLVTKWEGRYGAEALIARPNFHSRSIFAENLVAVKLEKTEVLLNKPIYIGFSVLDISKTCVYDFHYGYMLPTLDDYAKLLYTDTDSLIYEIRNHDVYDIMKRDIQNFDTSDYPPNNVFNMPQVNKKVVGLMKDECNGRIMTEFVGLKSKMYSVRIEGEDALKKAKGVKAGVVKKTICFDDYVNCLQKNLTQERCQYLFRSKLHEVQTVRQLKIALSPHDDKRRLLPNNTDTRPWGHFNDEQESMDVDL